MTFNIFAYDPTSPDGADAPSRHVDMNYPDFESARTLGNILVRAGWEARIVESDEKGHEVSLWCSPDWKHIDINAYPQETLGDA